MSRKNSHDDKEANVVDFASFREKKTLNQDLAGDRTPLFVSHLDGKVKGSPHFKRPTSQDFGDRIQRIRASLEKINELMAQLKRQQEDRKK